MWGVFLGENAKLPGACYCFGTVGDIQLAIDIGCVGFNSTRGYDELPGDLLVGFAQGDEVEDFQFPLTERLNQVAGRGGFYLHYRDPLRFGIELGE